MTPNPPSIPTVQKAFKLLLSPTSHLEPMEIPVPEPKAHEILLKVAAAGVCHSDLHILDGANPPHKEYVMGHEVVGTVAVLGSGVNQEDYPIGNLFAVHGPNGCGSCANCRLGFDNHCHRNPDWIGLGRDGGYEEYVAVPARAAVPVPEGVSPEVAAVTTDAVLTPYHAIKQAGINALYRVLVIGLGGLGMNAVQICKALGAHVSVTDLRPAALEQAKKFGADQVYEKLPEEGQNFDVVLDVVGANSTFTTAQTHVKALGTIVPIGLADTCLNVHQHPASMREIKFVSTFWGTSAELIESLDLVARGKVIPQVETGKLDDLIECLHKLEHGQIKARLALIP